MKAINSSLGGQKSGPAMAGMAGTAPTALIRTISCLTRPESATAVITPFLTVSILTNGTFRIPFYNSTSVLTLFLVHPSRAPNHPPGVAVQDRTVALPCLTTTVVKLTSQVPVQ